MSTTNNIQKEKFLLVAEHNPKLQDKHNRSTGLFSDNLDINKPTVSDLLFKNGLKPAYPKNEKMAFIFTCDVDNLFYNRTLKEKIGWIIGNSLRFKFSKIANEFKSIIFNSVSKNKSLQIISNWLSKRKICCTYFFMGLEKEDEDFNYSIEMAKSEIYKNLNPRDLIGLHGGHKAYNDLDILKKEKRRLETTLQIKVEHYRNHYLKMTLPKSWENLEKAEFLSDSTLAYNDLAGFRNGMCYPFHPYLINEKRYSRLIEVPLIVMDVQLLKYMNLNSEQSVSYVRNLVEEVKKVNGVFTLLWHNDRFEGEYGKLLERLFVEIFDKEEIWYTNQNELIELWNENGYFTQQEAIINETLINC